jgi:hypothetical protein
LYVVATGNVRSVIQRNIAGRVEELEQVAKDLRSVSFRLDPTLVDRLDQLGADLGTDLTGAITWCVVVALDNQQKLFGSVIRLHAESLLRAMNKGDGRRG